AKRKPKTEPNSKARSAGINQDVPRAPSTSLRVTAVPVRPQLSKCSPECVSYVSWRPGLIWKIRFHRGRLDRIVLFRVLLLRARTRTVPAIARTLRAVGLLDGGLPTKF